MVMSDGKEMEIIHFHCPCYFKKGHVQLIMLIIFSSVSIFIIRMQPLDVFHANKLNNNSQSKIFTAQRSV